MGAAAFFLGKKCGKVEALFPFHLHPYLHEGLRPHVCKGRSRQHRAEQKKHKQPIDAFRCFRFHFPFPSCLFRLRKQSSLASVARAICPPAFARFPFPLQERSSTARHSERMQFAAGKSSRVATMYSVPATHPTGGKRRKHLWTPPYGRVRTENADGRVLLPDVWHSRGAPVCAATEHFPFSP